MLLDQTIPNLFNGISQQPPALRSPTQAETSVNTDASLVNGLQKRKPTQHIAQINNFSYTNAHIHIIESQGTRFIAFFSNSALGIFNADTGVSTTIAYPSGTTYLSTANPRADIKCLTVADFTFVLNRSVVVGTEPYAAHAALTSTVQSFDKLPATPVVNAYHKILGTPGDGSTAYYVKGTAAGYIETAYYAAAGTEFNPAHIPWKLTRTGANEFTFAPNVWANRSTGDMVTCTNPSFTGRQIRDVFFYRNRLGFITSDSITMSRSGDYFNLWPQTQAAVLDDDPIDVGMAHPKIVDLQHAIPFNAELLLFGDRVQFQLTGGDVLSPRTVRVDPIMDFECSRVARPVGIGPNVYFSQPGTNHSLMREMFVRENSLQNDAGDITAHCPEYIPADVFDLAASPQHDTLFALCASEPNTLYVYKAKWKGEERVQSAWAKWTFGSAWENDTILGIATVGSYLYLCISRNLGLYLERMDLNEKLSQIADGDQQKWTVHLDRRTGFLSGTYDAGTDATTWTLPYDIHTSVKVELVVFGVGIDAGSGTRITNTVRPSLTTVRVSGDFSAQFCLAGVGYTMTHKLSPIYKRDNEGVPSVTGRLQLRKVAFMYRNTGYLRIDVTPFRRTTLTRVFNPMIIGLTQTGYSNIETGTFDASVMSDAETVGITLVNDTPYPTAIHSYEWTGFYTNRTKRQ